MSNRTAMSMYHVTPSVEKNFQSHRLSIGKSHCAKDNELHKWIETLKRNFSNFDKSFPIHNCVQLSHHFYRWFNIYATHTRTQFSHQLSLSFYLFENVFFVLFLVNNAHVCVRTKSYVRSFIVQQQYMCRNLYSFWIRQSRLVFVYQSIHEFTS